MWFVVNEKYIKCIQFYNFNQNFYNHCHVYIKIYLQVKISYSCKALRQLIAVHLHGFIKHSDLVPNCYDLITMTPKKWPWRARTSALYISLQIPKDHDYKILICTSVLPLAELLGLRLDLAKLLKIVYFHENQMVYPVRGNKGRDYQYGYNEILTTLAADKVLFNSNYNKTSFLENLNSHLKMQPDYKIKDIRETIEQKCTVVYYPLDLSKIDEIYKSRTCAESTSGILHIVWPHRWEFDKDPDTFYTVLCKLEDKEINFKVSILGESFTQKPEVFDKLRKKFSDKLVHCGFVENETDYFKILMDADVVLSTAIHEFFGVSVMEAVYCGCIPVVPNRLAYQEFFAGPVDEVYVSIQDLLMILSDLCHKKASGEIHKNYKQLVVPFNSKDWIVKMVKLLNLENYVVSN